MSWVKSSAMLACLLCINSLMPIIRRALLWLGVKFTIHTLTLQIPTSAGQEAFPSPAWNSCLDRPTSADSHTHKRVRARLRWQPTATDCPASSRRAAQVAFGVFPAWFSLGTSHQEPGRGHIWNHFEMRECRDQLKDRVSRQKTHQQPQNFTTSQTFWPLHSRAAMCRHLTWDSSWKILKFQVGNATDQFFLFNIQFCALTQAGRRTTAH